MSGFEILPMLATAASGIGAAASGAAGAIGSGLATAGTYAANMLPSLLGTGGAAAAGGTGAALTPALFESGAALSPIANFGSMADSLIMPGSSPYAVAPGLTEGMGKSMALPAALDTPYAPTSMADSFLGKVLNPSAMGAGSNIYFKMRELAAQEAAAKKPFSQPVNIKPGAPVSVSIQKPLAAGSPLQRYALALRKM